MISQYTLASLTARAISWVYWEPKSRISIFSVMLAKIDSLWFFDFWFMVTNAGALIGLTCKFTLSLSKGSFQLSVRYWAFYFSQITRMFTDSFLCKSVASVRFWPPCNLDAATVVIESIFQMGKLFTFGSIN